MRSAGLAAAAILTSLAPVSTAGAEQPCRLGLTPDMPVLVQGASFQRIELSGSVACLEKLSGHGVVVMKSDAVAQTISARVIDKAEAAPRYLELAAIPRDVPIALVTWRLLDENDKELVPLQTNVVALARPDKIEVKYHDEVIDRLQFPRAEKRIAVVDSSLEMDGSPPHREVLNIVNLIIPPSLPRSHGLLYWTLSATTWGDEVSFVDCIPPARQKRSSAPCSVADPTTIMFDVRSRRALPLVATLSLVNDYAAADNPWPERLRRAGESDDTMRRWLDVDVELAEESRRESIPLPLADAISLKCGAKGKRVANGGLVAITDTDLVESKCVASIEYDLLDERVKEGLSAYGPQSLEVEVSREGAGTPGRIVWPISPDRKAKRCPGEPAKEGCESIPLPAPQNAPAGQGLYNVRIAVAARSAKTIYREGTVDATASSLEGVSPQFRFQARLRARGPFGWSRAIRTFVTVPVQVTGLRFPANPRDLRSSDDPDAFQVVNLRAGVLFAIEPWNYDDGKNPWPLPLRFLGGFNLVEMSKEGFSPTLMVGVSFASPVVDVPTDLNTAVALGFFWEVDLRDDRPWKTGHRLMISLGFNVLSLFGAK